MITLRIVGVSEAAAAFADALDTEIAHALQVGAMLVASRARTDHTYTNQSGLLEQNTAFEQVTGQFGAGTLRATVKAKRRYASYVDEGTDRMAAKPFLMPAFESSEDRCYQSLESALDVAAGNAGWQ